MKKQIKDEWVRRLRSGDYEQGSGYLHFQDTYCCLGVLCDMAVEAGVIEETYRPSERIAVFGKTGDWQPGDWQTQTLPHSVAEWAGLLPTRSVTIDGRGDIRVYAHLPYDIPREDPENGSMPGVLDLMEANDNEGYTFGEIATAIEAGIKEDS